MASNKNQHFVPKCYLKPFSLDAAGVAINLFNLDRTRFINAAPLKHQCSRDYFYGEDLQLEKAFQVTEGEYSSLLRQVVSPGYKLTEEHRSFLREFWLLQHLRTESASLRAVEMAERMGTEAGIDSKEFRIGVKEAVQQSVSIAIDHLPVVQDMKVCLLRNRTSEPFLTSDDPAVLTNRWYLESPKTKGSSFGIGASGVLFFLPLTPQIFCVAYDGDVYSIPHENGWVDIRRISDIRSLNQHQFLNCNVNVYVHDAKHAESVQAQFEIVKPFRPRARHLAHYAIFAESEGDYSRFEVVDRQNAPEHERALIHIQTIHSTPSSWPLQIKCRQNGAVYTNGTGVGYIRNAFVGVYGPPEFHKEHPW